MTDLPPTASLDAAHSGGGRPVTPDRTDNAGVIARPPLIYLGGLIAGFALDALWPVPQLPAVWQYAAGLALVAAGFAGMIACMSRFRRAGTRVETHKPTTALVTAGPYRLSRNPIYVSLTLIYAGIAVAADNPWALALLLPILLLIRFGVIAREERYLERKFGEDYQRYKATVRRWI